MTHEETLDKLRTMRLHGMVHALEELEAQAPSNELSFHERIGLLVDREWTDRENRRLSRLLRAARAPRRVLGLGVAQKNVVVVVVVFVDLS